MKKRFLALFLTACMLLMVFPTTATAANEETTAGQTVVYAGEEFPVSLSGDGTEDVTISGYMDEEDWYVMDGLVLMYDGIYNAGMNASDDTATTWTELVGEHDADLSVSGQTWTELGLDVSDVAVKEATLSSSLNLNAMTLDYAFSASNVSGAMGAGGTYFYPFQVTGTGLSNFGNIRPDGVILNYNNGINSVFSLSTHLKDDTLYDITVTSDGSAARYAYLNGKSLNKQISSEDNYSIEKISIPVSPIKASDGTSQIQLEKTLHGLRLYERALDASEVAQNNAVDEARYEDDTYEVPGTVRAGGGETVLTEYDFEANATQTTLNNVALSDGLTLTLNKEGEYTLKFTHGGTTETMDVTVISKDEADEADGAAGLIEALPDTDSITSSHREAIAAAQAAYNALSETQKIRVGSALAEKLDACVAALDEALVDEGYTVAVTYDLNDNDSTVKATISLGSDDYKVVYKSSDFTLPVPARSLYTFQGWFDGDTQVTDGEGHAVTIWTNLSATALTAHWQAASASEGAYQISSSAQIYALARILAAAPKSDGDASLTPALKEDYALFGITSGYAAGYAALKTASYQMTADIALSSTDDRGSFFHGIPNFSGSFDGQDHTVAVSFDLTGYAPEKASYFGCLFANLDGAAVENIHLTGSVAGSFTVADGLQDMGVLAGCTVNSNQIANITSEVEVTLTATRGAKTPTIYFGSMVGRANANTDGLALTNCVNQGDLTITFTGFETNGGCRLGGLIGHAYDGVSMTGCKNLGDISTADSNTRTYAGGMNGTGSATCTNCVQGGNVASNGYKVSNFGMSSASTGNTLLVTVTGKAGETVAYTGDPSQTKTLTTDGETVTFSIPVAYENDVVENNGFSYNEYLTVNGTRLDWFNLTSTEITAKLNTSAASELTAPFQSESTALVLTKEADLIALQKALNDGDEASINALYALGNLPAPADYDEARLILQTAYYKLGENITVTSEDFTGIGNLAYPFSGHLNGNGKKIDLTISKAGIYTGLFGYISTGAGGAASIRDLALDVSITAALADGADYLIGGLVGRADAALTLDNVAVDVKGITVTGTAAKTIQAGGLFGNGYVTDKTDVDFTISGPVTVQASAANGIYLGGAVGQGSVTAPMTVTFKESAALSVKNDAGIADVGGLLGYYGGGSIDLRGCALVNETGSALAITGDAGEKTANAGGWIGRITSATTTADDWLNVDGTTQVTGEFSVSARGKSGTTAGGIVGFVNTSYSVSIGDYENKMPVTSGVYAGGLIGHVQSSGSKSLHITNSVNSAAVAGGSYSGGLVGSVNLESGSVSVTGGANTGSISEGNAYSGGLIGGLTCPDVKLEDCVNIGALENTAASGTVYMGGLVGQAGGASGLTIKNSANSGAMTAATGGTVNLGGLVGQVSSNATLTCDDALYLKTAEVTRAVGHPVAGDASGAVVLDTTALSGGATYGTPVAVLSASAPTGLTVVGGAELSGQNVTFTEAGSDVEATFLWDGVYTLYTTKVNVSSLDISSSAVITGVHSVYQNADAVADEADINVVYNGTVLEAGKDYTVRHNASDSKFTVTFTGNYTGTADAAYTVDAEVPAVTAKDYDGVYNSAPHSITVEVDGEYEVLYSADGATYYAAPVIATNAGTSVIYWKVVYSEGKEVTGRALLEIAPAVLTVKANDKTITVGDALPAYDYTVFDQQGNIMTSVSIAGIQISCPTADRNTVGSYPIVVEGGSAGGNYTVKHQNGILKVLSSGASMPPSGGSGGGFTSTTYPVTVDSGRHGDVTTSTKNAKQGATVTITVKPDDGYELDDLTVTDKNGKTIKVTEGKNGKYTFTMPASKVTVEATFAQIEKAPEHSFTDVPGGHWAESEITWAYESGYMNGNTATTFNPNGTVTRQQLWMILARLSGQRPANFEEAKAWAVDNGVSDGTNPGSAVSRQQLVTILYRYSAMMGYKTGGTADLTVFPDHASVAAYATDAMRWSVANSIVGGTAQGTLNPTGTATRAQFAVILFRFCGNIAK